ncbi:hypothetical protein M9H77_16993 [Catharanthus roseus]|uniref:Uncharacterized protein n=1 Tax=Catharanthus roseus TaxID=4058 RepID=A0ACC0B3C3_CATRO|nr:hypothetical protein M9H77_16993 [Catharanthus roseus]
MCRSCWWIFVVLFYIVFAYEFQQLKSRICNLGIVPRVDKSITIAFALKKGVNRYTSASQMLQVNGYTNLNIEKSHKSDVGCSPGKRAASKTDSPTSLSRKRVKENILDEKVEYDLQSTSTHPSLDTLDFKLKKVKSK